MVPRTRRRRATVPLAAVTEKLESRRLLSSQNSIGDVNDDGFEDTVIAFEGDDYRAKLAVIFGRDTPRAHQLDLKNLDPSDGVLLEPDVDGASMSGIGDINGDGVDDVSIRNYYYGLCCPRNITEVRFGSRDPSQLFAKGFRISGSFPMVSSSFIVSHGDFNEDGFNDLEIEITAAGRKIYSPPYSWHRYEGFTLFGREEFPGTITINNANSAPPPGVRTNYSSLRTPMFRYQHGIIDFSHVSDDLVVEIRRGTAQTYRREEFDVFYVHAHKKHVLEYGRIEPVYIRTHTYDWATQTSTPIESLEIKLGSGSDRLIVDADVPKLIVHGGSGDDFIQGTLQNDVLFGEDGNDTLIGGGGDDTFIGGFGRDSVEGTDSTPSLVASSIGSSSTGATRPEPSIREQQIVDLQVAATAFSLAERTDEESSHTSTEEHRTIADEVRILSDETDTANFDGLASNLFAWVKTWVASFVRGVSTSPIDRNDETGHGELTGENSAAVANPGSQMNEFVAKQTAGCGRDAQSLARVLCGTNGK